MDGKDGNAAAAGVYLGIDVGGTKIQTSLVTQSGSVLSRHRCPSPRDGGPDSVLAAVVAAAEETMRSEGFEPARLTALGIAIPGVVDPQRGLVVVTPNMSLSGVLIGPYLEDRFRVPVALGNDCNLGALGESWLGAARGTASSITILVGTGIGAGIVRKGKLLAGARQSAGEIGHIVMRIGGPQCGCGNFGCLEALASRSAVERELRAAVAAGRSTVLTELLGGDLSIIRSKALRDALDANDALVTEVMRKASEVLGHACLTVRHLVDPDVIVLGGGVIEACGNFMIPIIDAILESDRLAGTREGGHVVLSALGDDAVVLGAAALAATKAGRNPFKSRNSVLPEYPKIGEATLGEVVVGKRTFATDVTIRVDGTVKKRKQARVKQRHGTTHILDAVEVSKLCKGGPEVIFVGTGHSNQLHLDDEARNFLGRRLIQVELLPTPQLAEAYNACSARKAALVHVTC